MSELLRIIVDARTAQPRPECESVRGEWGEIANGKMSTVGISDTIRNRMLNGPAVADPSRGVVALEGSAPMTRIEAFLSRVDTRPDDGSACWIWRGGRDSAGYGRFGQTRAHRAAYEMLVGQIPEALVVRHRCDVPMCVRPSHLLLGTQADNVRDAVERGLIPNGDRASGAKYPQELVDRARELRAGGMTYREVADQLGAPFSAVREWLQGRVRASVTREAPVPRPIHAQYVDRVTR